MVLTLLDIQKLLNIIKLYKNKEFASSRNYVQRTFNDEPIKEARFPNYFDIEKFCNELKLLEIESEKIFLTELGKKILDCYDKENTISEEFKEIFIKECLFKTEIGEKIQNTFSKFYIGENQNKWYPKWEIYDLFEIPEILPILYESGLLEKKDTVVEINPKYLNFIKRTKIEKKLTLKQLENQLQNWKIIGEIAEEIVLKFEQNRLKNKGCIKESKKVKRISDEFANAGYDIESFSGDLKNGNPDMFIEVKGSSEKEFDFHWSSNEVETAKDLGEQYWIYFVPEINVTSRKTSRELIKIQNPSKTIFQDPSFKTEIEKYHITKIESS